MKDKVVLITGAKGGLGSFITQRFLTAGATVIGTSRSISQEDFPQASFTPLPVDFTQSAAVRDAVESVIRRFGRLDVLVHVLGGFAGGQAVAQTDDATWEQMRDLNLTAAFYVLRAAIPDLRKSGKGPYRSDWQPDSDRASCRSWCIRDV
jgi:NAD(P)-dependent dehydrogenase (short-subunit alcohol dehydrogenase family)